MPKTSRRSSSTRVRSLVERAQGDPRRFSKGPSARSLLKRAFSRSHRFGISPAINEEASALHVLDLKSRSVRKRNELTKEASGLLHEIQARGKAGFRTIQLMAARRPTSRLRALKFGSDTRPRFVELSSKASEILRRELHVRKTDLVEATMGVVYARTPFPVQEVFIRVADSSRNGYTLFKLDPEDRPVLYAKIASELMPRAESGEIQITESEREPFRVSSKHFVSTLKEFIVRHGIEHSGIIVLSRKALAEFSPQVPYLPTALIVEELKRKSQTIIPGKSVVIEG